MSHVDEGTLHAWLDGALDALPAAEAARVREHLAACETCRARLEEERAIRQEAADILGGALPGAVELPAFEELRSVAEARGRPRRASPRLYRLGWAASVVLALGVGWMLRDAAVPDFGRQGPTRTEAAPTEAGSGAAAPIEEAQVAAADAPADVGATEARKAPEASEALRERAPAAPSETEEPKASLADPAERRKGEPIDAAAPAARFDTFAFPRSVPEARAAVAAASRSDVAPLTPLLSDSLSRRQVRVGALAETAPAAVTPAVSHRGAPAAGAARLGDVVSSPVLALEAPPVSLMVPGLEVLSMVPLDVEGLPGGIRVRQRMADGDTLELVHLPAGLSPSGLGPVEDGRTELVLPWSDGWLVVRAHADRDTLRELVRRMGEGG